MKQNGFYPPTNIARQRQALSRRCFWLSGKR
nr:MAG TPA: hypothetical protein [Caudoviricetes sp.]